MMSRTLRSGSRFLVFYLCPSIGECKISDPGRYASAPVQSLGKTVVGAKAHRPQRATY